MTKNDSIFKLRLPEYLRDKLEQEAQGNSRSLTAEILNRLEESFSNDSDKMLELVERIAALEKAVFYTNVHPVAKYRKIHGWKQAELAEKLGVLSSQISKIENNKDSLSKDFIIRLCKIFNISIEYFINELDEYNK